MISKIKKFTLFFIENEEILLNRLQKKGIVEIETVEIEGFERKKISKTEIEETLKKVEFLKNILNEIEKENISQKLIITEKDEKEILKNFDLNKIYFDFLKLISEIDRRKRIINRIRNLKQEIFPLLNTDILFYQIFSLSNFSFFVFILPSKKKINALTEDLYIQKLEETGKNSIYLILFRKEHRDTAERLIKEIGGKFLVVRKWNKKIKEIYEKLEKLEEKNQNLILQLNEEKKKILDYKKEIYVFYDYFKNFYNFLLIKENLGLSRFVKGVKGWIKEKDVEILKKIVFEVSPESHLIIEDPQEGDNIPIILENNKFIEPFEIVTDLYGRPVYKNIDPTGHLSLFFAISFGFCLTDAGYGMLLILITSVLLKRFKFLPSFYKFLKLLLICGISTLFLGAITGSWFGDILYRVPYNIPIIKHLKNIVILNPLEGGDKATKFLLIALIIGYIQIIWGLILNVYNKLKNYSLKYCGESISLLLIQILVAIIVLGYILKLKMLVKIPSIFLILCFLYLMFEKAKTQKELMLKGFWAVYGVYSVIAGNLLGDVLSYSRLFGLGLTTSILGLVINQLVFMCKNIPYIGFFIAPLIFIVGHIGNLMINLLGSYVHTSRLQYLEFFTKFFEGGGRIFKPFKEERVYTVKISQ
ncbi:MAG: hypothetical protein NC926_04375 [Candidatus Omnitrophica bacterium]|nr:hypothetical protein [Candidatus Omnitrophota bacterium]